MPGTADAGERRVKVVARDDPDGMPALTLVKVLACNDAAAPWPCTLLEVTIKTGRTHQIRVHLAAQAMPIVGDDKYGDFARNRALARATGPAVLKRMFLHAWRFQCKHPSLDQRIDLQAEVPGELQQFLGAVIPGSVQKLAQAAAAQAPLAGSAPGHNQNQSIAPHPSPAA